MKYIIQDSRLKDVVNTYLDHRFTDYPVSRFDNYITLLDIHNEDDIENDVLMEYDHWDGRLYINQNFLNHINSIFPVGLEICAELIKDWFESKFDKKVVYTAY